MDVILLLMRNGRILLRERANTGYGDGAYEPPTGELADRETIVETAIRVAAAEAGIAIQAENMLWTKRTMQERIAFHTGQDVEQIERDSDRDRSSERAALVRLDEPLDHRVDP